eukprot:GFUD01015160.1.p1 GENE.GFUD01015160.1~~GFUD01015160.1.p1  ORF type:complete len:254 (+),score=61.09 GFUD01015160.1:59-820(+)
MNAPPSLKDLPNELLILILQFCNGRDILNIAEAFQSSEIDNLLNNKALWRKPVIGPNNLRKYLKYFGPQTTEITILGFVKVKPQSFKPSKQVWDKSEHLPDSVIASIRLRCPNLVTLNLQKCVIDTNEVKISLFPKTLKNLSLKSVALVNLPQVRTAVTASPFFCIKKALPQLETLFLENPWYLRPCDSLAIISGCKLKPSLAILGSDHHYTFSEDSSSLSRGARRDTSKHFLDLIDYHFVKNRYNTRRGQPE